MVRNVRMAAPTAAGSASRGLDIFYELASRAGLGSGPRTTTPTLQREIIEALAPHGDPAQRVPASVAERVNDLCAHLEARSPISKPATRGIQALDGRWRVRYSSAPPPSNGALGPFVGEAYQLVDVASETYANQLVSTTAPAPLAISLGLTPSPAISSCAHYYNPHSHTLTRLFARPYSRSFIRTRSLALCMFPISRGRAHLKASPFPTSLLPLAPPPQTLFGGFLDISLQADFSPSSDASLRVYFRTLTISLGGLRFPPIRFPAGTERTWLLSYTDADFRIVRAGVDGGRSTAREVGLIPKGEGEAADSYLFVLTRAPKLAPASTAAGKGAIAGLKTELLAACEGTRKGASADAATVSAVGDVMQRLQDAAQQRDAASSDQLVGEWEILWTTEAELLTLTDKVRGRSLLRLAGVGQGGGLVGIRLHIVMHSERGGKDSGTRRRRID
jgi:hypothetical protein